MIEGKRTSFSGYREKFVKAMTAVYDGHDSEAIFRGFNYKPPEKSKVAAGQSASSPSSGTNLP